MGKLNEVFVINEGQARRMYPELEAVIKKHARLIAQKRANDELGFEDDIADLLRQFAWDFEQAEGEDPRKLCP